MNQTQSSFPIRLQHNLHLTDSMNAYGGVEPLHLFLIELHNSCNHARSSDSILCLQKLSIWSAVNQQLRCTSSCGENDLLCCLLLVLTPVLPPLLSNIKVTTSPSTYFTPLPKAASITLRRARVASAHPLVGLMKISWTPL